MMRAAILSVLLCAAALPALAQASKGDAANGQVLYKRYCAGCHGPDGRGGAHTFMPHIESLTKKGYIDLVPDEYLYGVIADGGPSVGKSSYMPAWGKTLSEQQIWDIVAHIRSLPVY